MYEETHDFFTGRMEKYEETHDFLAGIAGKGMRQGKSTKKRMIFYRKRGKSTKKHMIFLRNKT